ncbi:MAG TPA: GNAT family N-acetyltransferase [Chloroflexia bacterium]|nr:GNAT family N-acetyltransferase [Chloroflexia bacterium]
MEIREFIWPDDYEAVVEMWKAVEMYRPSVDGFEHLEEVCRRNPGLFLLAAEPGAGVVGSVIGTYDGRRAYIYHVAVHPEHRRKGYATALIEEVERRIWALGAQKLRFMVGRENVSAQEFYKSVGFSHDKDISMSKLRPE